MTHVNEPISYFQKQQSVTHMMYQEGVCQSGGGRQKPYILKLSLSDYLKYFPQIP